MTLVIYIYSEKILCNNEEALETIGDIYIG
jgi:hypothetical protein